MVFAGTPAPARMSRAGGLLATVGKPWSLAGAGADRRSRHSPATAVGRSRQGRAAGRRHAARRPHPAAGCTLRASGASSSTCIIAPTPSRASSATARSSASRCATRGRRDILGSARRPGARDAAACRRSLPDRQRRHAGGRRSAGAGARSTSTPTRSSRWPWSTADPRVQRRRSPDADGIVTRHSAASSGSARFHFIGIQVVNAAVFAGVDPDVQSETVHGIYPHGDRAAGLARVRIFHTPARVLRHRHRPRDYLETAIALRRREEPAARSRPRLRDRRRARGRRTRSSGIASRSAPAPGSPTASSPTTSLIPAAHAKYDRMVIARRLDA